MKVCYLIQDITTRGGTERTTCCLADEMVRQGHSVTVVSVFHAYSHVAYPMDKRVRVVFVADERYDGEMSMLRRFGLMLKQILRIRRCDALREADVVVSQKLLASLLACYAGWAHKAMACEHYRYGMYNAAIRRYRNHLYNRFRGLVVLTDNDKQQFEQHGVKRVFVVENMVSIEPLPWHGAASKAALSVGRLDKQKGYDLLLEAIAQHKKELTDWRFDIFGDGAERQALIEQRRQLGIEAQVRFLPFTQEIEQEYARHAFYVMSSRFEGFPMVLLEAAAAGLPIVSFNCKEGPGVLLQHGGGLLVEAENIGRLGDAIVRMATDDALRNTLHTQTGAVVAPYSPEAIYTKWINVFETCKII